MNTEVRESAGKFLQLVQNAGVIAVLSVAEKSGLLKSMAKAGPLTSNQIAVRSGLSERYIIEILSTLACSEIVNYDSEKNTFELPDGFAGCLTDESSSHYLGGWITMVEGLMANSSKVAEAAKEGKGVPFEEYGGKVVCAMEKLNGPAFKTLLTRKWLPSIPGLHESLKNGIRVADLGCGTGLAVLSMAKEYPNSTFVGFDIDATSIERANHNLKAEGLKNVWFECIDGKELPSEPGFDFIITFDVIHDTGNPIAVLKAIQKALKKGGLYLMVEPRAGDNLEENMKYPSSQLLYSVSTLFCVNVSLAAGGPGYGALMGPKRARDLCAEAGFMSFRVANIQNHPNAFYEVRKEASNL